MRQCGRKKKMHFSEKKMSVKFLSFRERTAWVLEMKDSLMDKILWWGCVVGKGEPLSCLFFFFFANLQAKPRFLRVKELNCFHEESKDFECWWAAEERGFEGRSMSEGTLSPVATGSISGQIVRVENFLWGRKYGDLWKNDAVLNWGLSFSGC